MNRNKFNSLLILVKEKEQTVRANYVIVLRTVCKKHAPILNGIVFLFASEFFSRNQMEARQENIFWVLVILKAKQSRFQRAISHSIS